jgi:primosomal protein N' (replication factor Y) (superfamily II helicase)
VFAEVVFPVPIPKTFHYGIPEGLRDRAAAGCRVRAPFGRRMMTGFIVAVVPDVPADGFEIKEIKEVIDPAPVFSGEFLAFTRTLSAHFFTPWGEVLQAALPPSLVPRDRRRVSLTPAGKEALDAGTLVRREKELALLLGAGAAGPGPLAKRMGLRSLAALLRRMEGKGLIEIREVVPGPRRKKPGADPGDVSRQMDLSFVRGESSAISALEARIASGGFASFLLFGGRESRKATYERLVRKTLEAGGKVLFLAPEIALTEGLLESLRSGPGQIALLHSGLPDLRRELEWRAVVEGRADVVVGSRSALLAPLQGLRLLVVEEESDESYAQQEGQLFDARSGARIRSRAEGAVGVFGSARPNVEAYFEARADGSLVSLNAEERKIRTAIVDDRSERGIVSGVLAGKIRERIGRGDPVILFVNRRGYASLSFCRKCGKSPRCGRCDVALTYHRKDDRWVCHYCNAVVPASPNCPSCGGLLVRRPGRGIEAVAEELAKAFPGIPVASFDSDAVGREKERERMIDKFRRGRIPILLATSLLVHRTDVPRVPFVGILSPETLLGAADYRAGQKVYQAVSAMSAFALNDVRAEVVIQTSCPSHYSIRAAAAGDYDAFYAEEIEVRRLMNYPPFVRLAEVRLQGGNIRTLAAKSREFTAGLDAGNREIEVLGPALASVSRVRGLFQIQLILKARDGDVLDAALRGAAERVRVRKTIRLSW